MKNMMVGLIKRDSWLLLHQWRRLVVYFGSILLIDIMLVMYERSAVIEQEILGVSVQSFLSEPDKFPIQWVWNQVGILIIVIDFEKIFHGIQAVLCRTFQKENGIGIARYYAEVFWRVG